MNGRFVVSVVVLAIVSMLLGFVVHGVLLAGDYAKLVPNMFRTPEDSEHYMGYMIAQNIFFAIGFTWIYRHGREGKPWLGQGLRFGAAVAVMTTVPMFLIYYAVQPTPGDLVVKQIVFDSIAMLVMGLVAAAVNRDPVPSRA
jgi:drug/metabolite transporter (DMT)-like permease